MRLKSEAPDTLIQLIQDVGIPFDLHSDDAKELTSGRMNEIMKKFWIKGSQSEPYSPWQVCAKLCIIEIKKAVHHTLERTGASKRLLDYYTKNQSELQNLIAHPYFKLSGCTLYEIISGQTPDILEYLDYAWYQTIWYYDQETAFSEPHRKLAKWLGVAYWASQALCNYILPASSIPIVRSTIQALSRNENESLDILEQIKSLNRSIRDSIEIS